MPRRPRIAWFTPLDLTDLTRSGYFSRLVLDELCDFDIELFVDDADWCALRKQKNFNQTCWSRPVEHFLNAFVRDEADPFDAFFYQIEDSPRTAFIEQVFPIFPGITLFHDLNLMRLKNDPHHRMRDSLSETPEDERDDRVVRIDEWRRRGWSTEIVSAQFATGARVAQRSTAVLVKNNHAAHELSSKDLVLPVTSTVFPVHPVVPSDRARCRELVMEVRQWPAQEFRIGMSSRTMLDERATLILEAYLQAKFSAELPGRLVWIVTDIESKEFAEKLLDRVPSAGHAVEVLYVTRWEEYQAAICALDCFVGLKFDVLREPPAGVYLSLAAGVPVVVSDFGPSSEFPEQSVIKISPGHGEQATLTELFTELSADLASSPPGSRREALSSRQGQSGFEFAETCLTADQAAADIRGAFTTYRDFLSAELSLKRSAALEAERVILKNILRSSAPLTPSGEGLELFLPLGLQRGSER